MRDRHIRMTIDASDIGGFALTPYDVLEVSGTFRMMPGGGKTIEDICVEWVHYAFKTGGEVAKILHDITPSLSPEQLGRCADELFNWMDERYEEYAEIFSARH